MECQGRERREGLVPSRSGDHRFLLAPERARDRDAGGTFAPFFLASLRPMAIACLRLFTFPPDPLSRVPFFRRRMADSTLFDADLLYVAIGYFSEMLNAQSL
jgi:hypothetical protein